MKEAKILLNSEILVLPLAFVSRRKFTCQVENLLEYDDPNFVWPDSNNSRCDIYGEIKIMRKIRVCDDR